MPQEVIKLVIEGTIYEETLNLYDRPNLLGLIENHKGQRRETIAMRLGVPFDTLKSIVKSGMSWGTMVYRKEIDEEGKEVMREYFSDLSSYSMLCYLIDNLDGSSTFIMGKVTDEELYRDAFNDIIGG